MRYTNEKTVPIRHALSGTVVEGCSQHYVHPAGSDGLYLVVDEKSNFREDNFQKAMAEMSDANITDTKKQGESDVCDTQRPCSDSSALASHYALLNLNPGLPPAPESPRRLRF